MNLEGVISIFKLIPAIIVAIKAVEEFVPVAGAGKAKLDVIRQVLEVASDQAKLIWPAIEKIVGSLVALANTFGVFRHDKTA